MPHSLPNFKLEMLAHMKRSFSLDSKVVDLGAGAGWTGLVIRAAGFDNIDGVEVWKDWVPNFLLKKIYKEVIVADVRQILDFSKWDIAILGDMIEHMKVSEAKVMLERIYASGTFCYAIVPWQKKQGPWEGNPFEAHIQDDLTPELMEKRYPSLKLVNKDQWKGFYVSAEHKRG